MIQGILLDFDGTVVDSEISRFESSKKVLMEYGVELLKKDWESTYKSLGSTDMFSRIIKQHRLNVSAEELYNKAKEIRKEIETQEGVPLISGFLEFLEKAQELDLKIIVCSGGTTEHIERILKQCDLDLEGFGREAYDKRKPYADAWLFGLNKLGLQRDEVLLFDDASSGVEAGLRAGISKCCAINYDDKDFDGFEKIEEENGVKLFRKFKNWEEVDLEELVKDTTNK